MKALLQRVKEADVTVEGELIGSINQGLLIFLGLETEDDLNVGKRAIKKFLSYRIFSDEKGRMNLSRRDIEGGVLLVPQFTLVAETDRGSRPSFSRAMPPDKAEKLFNEIYQVLLSDHHTVATGCFGADMIVTLVNDGPVTFLLEQH